MPRIKLIINPWADHGRAGQQADVVRSLVDEFVARPPKGGGPYEARWVGTVYPGQAADMAQEAAEEGYDIVTAVGGDGTVHEVVNGLMRLPDERRPKLGVIPLGHGNDFAANFGLPHNPGESVKHLFNGSQQTLDVCKIADKSGRAEFFDNTVNIGFGGAVAIATRKITRLNGFWMYLAAVLQTIAVNYDAPRIRFTIDGEEAEKEVLLFAITNGPREGGGFHIAPGAEMSDGLLNYVTIDKVGRAMMLRLIPEVMEGRHLRFSQVESGTAKRITLESDRGLPVHADGEIFGPYEADLRYLEAEVIPGALQVAM